jgi:hypothetical protein
MDKETEEIVRAYIKQWWSYLDEHPEVAKDMAVMCACMGPAPECRCARVARLLREFVDAKAV